MFRKANVAAMLTIEKSEKDELFKLKDTESIMRQRYWQTILKTQQKLLYNLFDRINLYIHNCAGPPSGKEKTKQTW